MKNLNKQSKNMELNGPSFRENIVLIVALILWSKDGMENSNKKSSKEQQIKVIKTKVNRRNKIPINLKESENKNEDLDKKKKYRKRIRYEDGTRANARNKDSSSRVKKVKGN